MEEKKDLLTICSVCEKIRINDKSDLWLEREDNPVLYDRFVDMFKGRISDGYYPEDSERAMKEAEEF